MFRRSSSGQKTALRAFYLRASWAAPTGGNQEVLQGKTEVPIALPESEAEWTGVAADSLPSPIVL